MSLVARAIEEAGIPTVVLGAAKDIVEHVGVPRFAFSDVPLGHSTGLPNDPESQRQALDDALNVLETARGPRTTFQTAMVWKNGDHSWKKDIMNLSQLTPERIAREREGFETEKAKAREANGQEAR